MGIAALKQMIQANIPERYGGDSVDLWWVLAEVPENPGLRTYMNRWGPMILPTA
jgi:hypothetical protein